MAYVITGATGHIGNNVVKKLIEMQEEVKVLVRKIDKSIINLPIQYLVGDIFDEAFLNKNINKEDIVIHLAGIIDIKNKYPNETYKINYLGTKTIIDICLKKQIKGFIYCSSVDAIYKHDKHSPIKEPTKIEADKFKQNYPRSKALATQYVMDIMNKNPEFKVNIVYPSAVIGINDFKPSSVGKVICDCLKGKLEFGIRGGYNFIDVEDLSYAIINIAKQPSSGSYIIAGHNVTVFELYDKINEVIGKEKKVFKIPMFVVYLAIPFVPYLSTFMLKTLNENYNYVVDKAFQEINFQLTPFDTTIRKTIKWFKENNNE